MHSTKSQSFERLHAGSPTDAPYLGTPTNAGNAAAVALPMVDVDEKKIERAGVQDRTCWTTFVGAAMLIVGFAGLAVWSRWESPEGGKAVTIHSFEYFLFCMLGGVLSGLPHTILTPMDLIKCRVQCNEYTSLSDGVKQLYAEGRKQGLLVTISLFCRGWAPTLIGYSIQGAMKFGLYEFFKYFYAMKVFGLEFAAHNRVLVFLLASASAELFADVGLAPWEATKVKMQTTRTYPPVLGIVVPRMYYTEGLHGFFKGLPALWGRQIPYTMMKFASFEKCVELMYAVVLQIPKHQATSRMQLGVSLTAGVCAGALCCIVSHPADTLVSKLNQRADSTAGALVKELGCRGLWKGIGARLLMISTITAMQWVIYDSFKVAVGLPTTGGSAPAPSGAPK